MIRIQRSIINQLVEWTKEESPNEAAGYLFCQNTIFKKIITGNHSGAHFVAENPEQLLRWIEKYGSPTAIFHSHPCAAIPSGTDLEYMSTTIPIFDCVWFIMSNTMRLRAWTIFGNYFRFPMRGECISPREIEVEIYE